MGPKGTPPLCWASGTGVTWFLVGQPEGSAFSSLTLGLPVPGQHLWEGHRFHLDLGTVLEPFWARASMGRSRKTGSSGRREIQKGSHTLLVISWVCTSHSFGSARVCLRCSLKWRTGAVLSRRWVRVGSSQAPVAGRAPTRALTPAV